MCIRDRPYFVPYRGALSTGVHILTFAPVSVSWKSGAQSLTDSTGRALSLTTSADSTTMTDQALGFSAAYATAGGAVSRVTFSPSGVRGSHTISLEFTPALAPGSQSSFDVLIGRKTKIAAGSVQVSAGPTVTESWTFTAPDALKNLSAKATASLQP